MPRITEIDRALGACDRCGEMYIVCISGKDIIPIGISDCRECGGTEFSFRKDDSSHPPVADGSSQSSVAED